MKTAERSREAFLLSERVFKGNGDEGDLSRSRIAAIRKYGIVV